MLSRFVAILSLAAMLVACCGTDMRARTIEPQMMIDLNDATAALLSDDEGGGYYVSCSAVWLSSKRMVSAAHCVASAGANELDEFMAELTGKDWDPVGKPVQFITWRDALSLKDPERISVANAGIVVAYDAKTDLALIEAVDGGLDHETVSLSWNGVTQGDSVFVVGHTLGLSWSFSPGVVGAVRTMENVRGDKEKMIQVVSGANRGNSGGGLFNTSGQLVGICSFLANTTVLTFFVDTSVVRNFLETH